MAASYNKFSEENWESFWKIEGLKSCCAGGNSTSLEEHEGYANQPDELLRMVESCSLPVSIAFPGGNGKLQLLHNCVVGSQSSRIMGITGFSYFAAFKELSTKALAEKLKIDSARGKLKIPSLEDFGTVKSGEEFKDLKGTGDKELGALRDLPQSLWVTPQVIQCFFGSKAVDVENIGDELALLLEVWDDEELEARLKPLCDFLLFAWVVDRGCCPNSRMTLTDPSEDTETQARMEKVVSRKEEVFAESIPRELRKDKGGDDGEKRRGLEERGRSMDRQGTKRDRSFSRSRSEGGNPNEHCRSRRSESNQSRPRERIRGGGERTTDRSDRARGADPFGGGCAPRMGKEIGGHPSDSELLRAMARGITTMASLQNEKVLRDRSEKSVLGKLSDRQNSLFVLLSAEDWEDHCPQLNPAATKLLSSQNPEKQWNLINDWAMRWPGRVSKSGVIQFLAKGHAARHLPGGFTAFMFSPMRHMIEDPRDRKRNIKMTHDKEGSTLDEEALTFCARNDYHVPSSIEETEVQLEMTLLMLEKMTSEQSIATDGYLEGQILL